MCWVIPGQPGLEGWDQIGSGWLRGADTAWGEDWRLSWSEGLAPNFVVRRAVTSLRPKSWLRNRHSCPQKEQDITFFENMRISPRCSLSHTPPSRSNKTRELSVRKLIWNNFGNRFRSPCCTTSNPRPCCFRSHSRRRPRMSPWYDISTFVCRSETFPACWLRH